MIPQFHQKGSFEYHTDTRKQANWLVVYGVAQRLPKLWDKDNLGSLLVLRIVPKSVNTIKDICQQLDTSR